MSKFTTITLMLLVALMFTNTVSASTVVEKDNYMPVYYQFAYWEQIYEQNPTNIEAFYHLNIMASAYSINGKYDGLNAGMEIRRLSNNPQVPNYHDIVFVDNVQDWNSVY